MTYRRRPPGAAVGASTLYTRIDPEAAEVADVLARRLGVSKAEFIQTLLFHVGDTLNDQGVPPWWPKPVTNRRRPAGAVIGASTLFTRIHPEAAEVADVLARRLGISKAEFIQTLLFHVGDTLNDQGVPPWWPKPVTNPEELDLQTA